MSYTPTTWTEGVTKVGPTNLNHLETGLQAAAAVADAAVAKPAGPATNSGLVWNGSAWVAALLVNGNIDPAANIAYSKLSLAGSIVNNDISSGAAVAYSKLSLTGSITNTDVSASAGIVASKIGSLPGTSFPGSPADGDEYVYAADAANGVYWHFKYRTATSKWIFIGGAPLLAEVTTDEAVSGTAYAALATAGPSVALPFAGDYDIEIGCGIYNVSATALMSYDIGGTGAVDADGYTANPGGVTSVISGSRRRRKTGLTAVTLTAKYKSSVTAMHFLNRWMAVWPVQK